MVRQLFDAPVVNAVPEVLPVLPAGSIWVQDGELNLRPSETLPFIDPGKRTIVLDFDGVITSPQELKVQLLNQLGYNLLPEETDGKFAKQRMLEQIPARQKAGVSQDYEAMIHQLYIDRILEIPPEKDAIEVIRELAASEAFNLVVLTSRRSTDEEPEVQAAGRWLQVNELKFTAIIAANNKDKGPILMLLKPDLFVDDSLDKIDGAMATLAGESQTRLALFRQRANQHSTPSSLVHDLTGGWQEIRQIALGLGEKQ